MTVTYAGVTYPLHEFFLRVLPHALSQERSRALAAARQVKNAEMLKKLLPAIKPIEGKKTKAPYEDALWAAGFAVDGRKSGEMLEVVFVDRKTQERMMLLVLGGWRGLVETVEQVIENATRAKDDQTTNVVEGVDFTPLTTTDYWRERVQFNRNRSHYGYVGMERGLTPDDLRSIVHGGYDGNLKYLDEALVLKVKEAVQQVLDELGQVEQVYRTGALYKAVTLLSSGKVDEAVKLLTPTVQNEAQDEEIPAAA